MQSWVERIRGTSVLLRQIHGGEGGVIENVDLIITASRHRPADVLFRSLTRAGIVKELFVVGDCLRRALVPGGYPRGLWRGAL